MQRKVPSAITNITLDDCEDVDTYKRVFQMIFEALGQSQHFKMMTGKRIQS